MTSHRTSARAVPLLAALGALALFHSPSVAAVYHVAPAGNDANTGTSPGAAWATISKANSRVAPGDVVIVADGTYGHFPNPAVSGTAGARIAYVGNLASPASVRITAGGSLSRAHVSVKGFELASGFALTGVRDSIAFCVVKGSKPQITGADDCVIARCTFESTRFWVVGSESDTLTVAERDTVAYCTFRLDPDDLSGHTIRFKALDACVFKHLRFDITIGPNGKGASCTKLFHVKNTLFTDCHWDVTNNRTSDADEAGWFVLRDMTLNNSFVRDTVILRGPGPVQFFGAASGTYPGTVLNNNFIDCVIKAAGPLDYDFAIYYQDRAQSDTLKGCVIVGSEGGVRFNGLTGDVLVDHCTIAGFDPKPGALNFSSYGGSAWSGNLKVENSLLYTAMSAVRALRTAALYIELPATDGHFGMNYNLYFGPMRRDSSIYASTFGTTSPGPTYNWCTSKGHDCASVFGDPKFTNASSVLGFDAAPLSGSWAIGTGRGGSDIGAVRFSGPDTNAPEAVSDAGVTQFGDNFATLQWTASGDDGAVGRATAYDVRHSLSPITSASFGSATPVPSPPGPQSAGSLETFTVFGLSPGRTYYFALKSRDEAGNWSTASNATSATTHPSDITAPASIRDLKPGP